MSSGPIDRGRGPGGDAKRGTVDHPAAQPTPGRQAPLDAERVKSQQRVASQAGFVRDKGPEGHLHLGDYGRAPIPLDPADVDPQHWSARSLRAVTDHLTLKAAKFAEIKKTLNNEKSGLAAALVASLLGRADRALRRWRRKSVDGAADDGAEVFVATDEATGEPRSTDVQRSREQGSGTLDTAALRGHLESLFDIPCAEDPSEMGRVLLAAGLVVGGRGKGLAGQQAEQTRDIAMAEAISEAIEQGKQAVHEFQQMHSKIDRQVNVHRTFLFKR